MRRTLSNNVNLVRLPNDKSLLLNYLRKKIREFFSIYEHEPNIEELANFTNTKITEISDI